MAKTPEYVKRATTNYRNKFDIQQLRLPKGTKEQIIAKYGDISVNNYIVGLVLADLEANKEQQEKTQQEEQPEQITTERPKDQKTNLIQYMKQKISTS